ncbi:MAG: PAS domain S-box protein, partial [Chloroflexota bacterium]
MKDSGVKVLVVDDEEVIRHLVSRRLSGLGYHCEEAGSAREALGSLSSGHFDLVLLDVRMPGRSGADLVPEIVSSYPDTAVVMATAVDDVQVAVECMKNGALDYLTKPFNFDEVTVSVERALERKRMEVELREYRHSLERKVSEQTEKIRREQEFSSALLAGMRDGLSVLDSRGVHLDVNSALCRMTGFSREELIGVGPPHPYWAPEAHEEIEASFRQSLEGNFDDVQLTFMRKGGERFPALVSPSWVRDPQGRVVAYFATVKDMTGPKRVEEELRQARARLERMVDSAFDVTAEFDTEGYLMSVSPGVRRVLGYRPDELVGTDLGDIIANEDIPRAEDTLQEVLQGRAAHGLEFTFRHKNGANVLAEVNVLPIWQDNKPVGAQGTFRDITARKQAEQEVRHSLEHLRRTRDGVIQAISRTLDLRDPYTGGHQQRMTQLASAIAGEMGLSEDEQEAIRVAGMLHDIGKISVPAEILTKPGQLTGLEFSLIKQHPETGYEITRT